MREELPLLLDRIQELVDERADGPPEPLLERMEHTLTDGYAHALALESESIRIKKKIGELLTEVERGENTADLGRLSDRLADTGGELARLRRRLEALRRRADGVRRATTSAAR